MSNYADINFLDSLGGITEEAKSKALGFANHPNREVVLPAYNEAIHEDWILCQAKKEDILHAWATKDTFCARGCTDGWNWSSTAVKFPDPDRYGGEVIFHLFPHGSSLDCGVYHRKGIVARVLVLPIDPGWIA